MKYIYTVEQELSKKIKEQEIHSYDATKRLEQIIALGTASTLTLGNGRQQTEVGTRPKSRTFPENV